MAQVTRIGRVLVPVADQDEAIAFYTQVLGFTLTADMAIRAGCRWVEVTPPGGGAAVALVPPQGDYQPGRMTGISLSSPDPRADHAELAGQAASTWTPRSWAATAPCRRCSSSATTTRTR